jgi:hypothetical protein
MAQQQQGWDLKPYGENAWIVFSVSRLLSYIVLDSKRSTGYLLENSLL